jgi:hypothetical protein
MAKTESQGRCRKAMAPDIFLEMMINSVHDRCTLWPFGKTSGGYGAVTLDGRHCSTHSASWQIFNNQKVPKGYFVCHSCDVKLCFNPFHLFIDTPKGNMEDRDRKGRQARGIRSGVSKLNEEQVNEIRSLYPSLDTVKLGVKFDVHPSTVGNIVRKKTWKHLL